MDRSPSLTTAAHVMISGAIVLALFVACATNPPDSPGDDVVRRTNRAASIPPAPATESPESRIERVGDLRSLDSDTVLISAQRFARETQQLIDRGDFDGWKKLLSDGYREHYGDAQKLERLSQHARLRHAGIHLESLQDYFDHVVRMSRHDTSVDRVKIIDEQRAIAFAKVNGEEFVLYHLIWDDGWEIDRY